MNIVVAFGRSRNSENIRRILVQSGYPVVSMCVTGAQALQAAHELDAGLLICGARFPDMTYTELLSDLPEGLPMLLVAPAEICQEREAPDLICLSLPLKVHELLETVEMIAYEAGRRKRRQRNVPRERSGAEREIIDRAKRLLIERNNMTEEEAHRYLQKRSMDNATSLVETAEMVANLF